MKNSISNKAATGLFTLLAYMAKFFKVSFIVGSHAAFFSAASIIVPVSGMVGGLYVSAAVCAISFIIKIIGGGIMPFKYLAYHIPGFCAALYLSSGSVFIRVLLPLACMVAFMVHPVGAGAGAYTLYWLVPVALYAVRSKNLFLTMLGSTLVAHAVGSVIWLYAQPMTSAVWLGLIPVVFVERMTYALGMVLLYTIVCTVIKKYTLWRGDSRDQALGLHNGRQSTLGTP